ncbi:MAG TPA: TonB family protein [Thermoanaerobaculia bacterium]|nr:TonB family protein [Thermoanaerobaculia bacterium]
MFESALIDRQKPRRPLRVFVTSAGLHFALAATVVSAAYWTIGPVAEPQENAIFFAQLPPPPPAAASAPSRPVTVKPPTAPTVTPPAVVQPDPEPAKDPKPAQAESTGPATDDPTPPTASTNGPGVPGANGPGVPGATELRGPGVLPGVPAVSDQPYRIIGQAIRPPVAVTRVEPRYTEEARKIRLQGTVVLEAIIDEQGRVTNVNILKGLSFGLDREAANAVSQWRFRPATLEGRPVKVYFNLTVQFHLT